MIQQENTQHHKINGFTRTPHYLQIISYVIFLGQLVAFTLFVQPLCSGAVKIVGGLLYYASTLAVIIYAFNCTYIDPTDEVVIQERQAKILNQDIDFSQYDYFCNSCKTHVNDGSKHCRQCDRCVQDFDHHCKWLNNCIGGKNYKQFFRLIFFVLFNMASFSIFSIYSLIITLLYSDELELDQRLDVSVQGADAVLTIKIIVIFFSIISSIFFILDLNLLLFHIYLQTIHMTTYDYIMKRRQKIEQRKIMLDQYPNSNNSNNLRERQQQLDQIEEDESNQQSIRQDDGVCTCIKQMLKAKKKNQVHNMDQNMYDLNKRNSDELKSEKIINNIAQKDQLEERHPILDNMNDQICHSVDIEESDNQTDIEKDKQQLSENPPKLRDQILSKDQLMMMEENKSQNQISGLLRIDPVQKTVNITNKQQKQMKYLSQSLRLSQEINLDQDNIKTLF